MSDQTALTFTSHGPHLRFCVLGANARRFLGGSPSAFPRPLWIVRTLCVWREMADMTRRGGGGIVRFGGGVFAVILLFLDFVGCGRIKSSSE